MAGVGRSRFGTRCGGRRRAQTVEEKVQFVGEIEPAAQADAGPARQRKFRFPVDLGGATVVIRATWTSLVMTLGEEAAKTVMVRFRPIDLL
ncbi:hypothetical protein [Frankia sp. AgKG'84/4]|uniref:hypothetical protein n=1 Tax=Frankia sp. AgKG'84/4 TaxID=573490 RepID=UPI002029FE0B|nr:hypothetical protein [Frankia sp. AgKG'84/4]MCL9792786.1 hypothetical protein [Frankia sp. AgKG'84/4]